MKISIILIKKDSKSTFKEHSAQNLSENYQNKNHYHGYNVLGSMICLYQQLTKRNDFQ